MFNYKKFKKIALDQPAQPQSGKILNELDPSTPSEEQAKEQVNAEAQKKAAGLNNAFRYYGTAKNLFEKLTAALAEVKSSPYASIQPGRLTDACNAIGKTLDAENVINPDEIQDIYQQYINAFKKMQASYESMYSEYEKIKDDKNVLRYISIGVGKNQNEPELEFRAAVEQAFQQMEYDLKLNEVKITKQQRQFMQFNILYQDMFNYYSLLSRICETKTRYDAQVEQFKFGSPEDYQALLSYYEYGISLLQIMAPKAASIMPTQAKNIQSYYGSIIESARAEITKLSVAPLKALYGRK